MPGRGRQSTSAASGLLLGAATGAVVLAFLALAVGWLVAFYPVLTALPTAADRIYRLMWFGSWI